MGKPALPRAAFGAGAFVAATAVIVPSTAAPADRGGGATAFRCAVSSLTERPVPGRPAFNFGNRGIAVSLPPRATFVAVPEGTPGHAWVQRDGWIRTKIGWWRAHGTLRLVGRRIDRPARPLRAEIGSVSWDSGGEFIPSLLYFASVGCWRITATAGDARLSVIVRVVKR